MSSSELQITSFDPVDIKARLIDYLQSTEEFGDFNYEGSAINTIIDLLVRNDTYLAYLANMVSNESFIQSAQIRGNVVGNAAKLSYVPRSWTSARIVCDLEITPSNPETAPNAITIPAGYNFLAAIDGISYSFVTTESVTIQYNSDDEVYSVQDLEIYQGQYITNRFVYDSNEKKIVVPNERIDTSTLIVSVRDSNSLSISTAYQKADDIKELSSTSNVYFLNQNSNGLYYIEFGRNIIGVEPSDDSIVDISYVNCDELHANGLGTLLAAEPIEGYSNISVTVTTPAYGGDSQEDIESIRYLAPKSYQAQDRALNASDYEVLIRQNFPFVRSVSSWGGEENDIPMYSNVLISVLSDNFTRLTTSVKNQIIEFLKDYRVGSTTPVIVDPNIYGLDLDVFFAIDKTRTNKTFNQLSTEINSVCSSYNTLELGQFYKEYNNSLLVSMLMDIQGIRSVVVEKTVFYDFTVLRFANPIYEVKFDNPIVEGSLGLSEFSIASGATNSRLYDNSGFVYVSYTNSSGVTVTNTVGTVDYETGQVEFVLNMLQDATTVRLRAIPLEENFVSRRNSVVYVNNVSTSLLGS